MTDSAAAAPGRFRGRLYLLLGLACAVVGRVCVRCTVLPQELDDALVHAHHGGARKYWSPHLCGKSEPSGAYLALLVVGLLAVAEITFLYAVRLPPYTARSRQGCRFRHSATRRSDGSLFTQRDLSSSEQSSVLVFFRGRW